MGLHITKDQYDRIVSMIHSIGETSELEARIAKVIDPYAFQRVLAYLNTSSQKTTKSDEVLDITSRDFPNARISITSLDEISAYCKTQSCTTVSGMRKSRTTIPEKIEEHNVVIKISDEVPMPNIEASNILAAMKKSVKYFRMKKRTSFQLSSEFRIDCTLIRTASGTRLSTASINIAPLTYEIEIEYTGSKPASTDVSHIIARAMLAIVSELLKVVDDSEYLIPASKSQSVIMEYYQLAFPNQAFEAAKMRYNPKSMFIGPQPISMELRNLLDPKYAQDSVKVSYTVTHKADGERNLVFVDNVGKVYMINNRLVVKPTKLNCPAFTSSIFDAEVVTYKSERRIYIFDSYYVNGQSVASLPLMVDAESGADTRIKQARNFATSAIHSKDDKHSIHVKEFEIISPTCIEGRELFIACRKLLQEQKGKLLPFNTDGLIFTPLNAPVGATPGSSDIRLGGTWMSTLKWKPAHDNTIDFLVRIRKVPGSQHDEVQHNEVGSGLSKLLDLYVGTSVSDTTAWEYCNNNRPRRGYMPVLFEPAGVDDLSTVNTTQVALDSDGALRCTNGDIIVDDSIVEMTWDAKHKMWSPMRVRVDKTELYKSTRSISGTANNSEVAERVWSSIMFPVLEAHIMGTVKVTQDMIPLDLNKYYVNNTFVDRSKTLTINMANFHNLWVKNRHLIGRFKGVAKSLIDLGCGKGGDLGKWIDAGFTKVLGLDLYSDNINNPQNGVYRRLMKIARRADTNYSRNTHTYMFLPFDTSVRITKESIMEMPNTQERTLAMVAFGHTPPPQRSLSYLSGMASDGFDVVSTQFAIHYFFKNDITLHNYLYNVDKCLKPGGYFIGTCFDAHAIASALSSTDYISGEKNDKLIWSIQRMYEVPFKPRQTGQAIKVFMETISQPIDEYLVDYDYLTQELAKYNIHPLTKEECTTLSLEKTSGLFSDLFGELQSYVSNAKRNLPQHEQWMINIVDQMGSSDAEKRISFFNRWFIYRKAATTTSQKGGATSTPKPKSKPKAIIL